MTRLLLHSILDCCGIIHSASLRKGDLVCSALVVLLAAALAAAGGAPLDQAFFISCVIQAWIALQSAVCPRR